MVHTILKNGINIWVYSHISMNKYTSCLVHIVPYVLFYAGICLLSESMLELYSMVNFHVITDCRNVQGGISLLLHLSTCNIRWVTGTNKYNPKSTRALLTQQVKILQVICNKECYDEMNIIKGKKMNIQKPTWNNFLVNVVGQVVYYSEGKCNQLSGNRSLIH